MVLEVVAVCTLVAKIASTIGSFEKVLTTCNWLKKVASTEWKKELDKYIEYLQVVKEVTGRYGTSNCSETAITGALQLLDGELTESWSKVDKWIQKNIVCKQLRAADFIKEMKSSRTTIDQNLQLFSTAVQTCRDEEGNPATPQTQQAVPQEKKEFEGNPATPQTQQAVPQEGNPARPQTQQAVPQEKKEFEEEEKEKEKTDWPAIFFVIACLVVITKWTVITNWTVIFFRIITKWSVIFFMHACLLALAYACLVALIHACEVMEVEVTRKLEKEKEENEYKAWLKENITKSTDGWPSYKTVWEGATNSKLDLAERKILFENHVDGLREQYLREYRQLLKEVITPNLESKYLTSWSCAKSLMLRRERFPLVPEPEMETEWRGHVEQILKKKGTLGKKGKQQ